MADTRALLIDAELYDSMLALLGRDEAALRARVERSFRFRLRAAPLGSFKAWLRRAGYAETTIRVYGGRFVRIHQHGQGAWVPPGLAHVRRVVAAFQAGAPPAKLPARGAPRTRPSGGLPTVEEDTGRTGSYRAWLLELGYAESTAYSYSRAYAAARGIDHCAAYQLRLDHPSWSPRNQDLAAAFDAGELPPPPRRGARPKLLRGELDPESPELARIVIA